MTITWFGVMLALGFFAGMANWVWQGRREGRDAAFASDLLMWILIPAILGARLAYVVSDWAYFVEEPARIFRIDQGGLIFSGGVVGAGVGVWWFSRRRGAGLLSLVDFVILSLPLGHAFGRVGCFLNGCCYGRLHEGALAVRYPVASFAWNAHLDAGLITRFSLHSRWVHPVQLYEAAINLVIFGCLAWLYPRFRRRPGFVAGAYLVAYPVARFLMERLRGDPRQSAGVLNVAQVVSLGLVALGVVLLARAGRSEGGTGGGESSGPANVEERRNGHG